MADIGKDRFGNPEEEEGKSRKFQVIDKRFLEVEEPAPPPAPKEAAPPAAAATEAPSSAPVEPPREARTIKVDLPVPEPASDLAPAEIVLEPSADDEVQPMPAGLNPDPLAISNALLFFIEELFTRVLIFLGLTPNPQTGLTVKNLEQAQRGIQIIELMIGEVRRDLASPEIDVNLTRMLTQLKAAYVQVVTGGVGPGAGLGGLGGGPLR